MPARRLRQEKAAQEEFRKRIKAKVQADKEKMKEKLDEEAPSFIAWALKPVFGVAFDIQRAGWDDKGEGGEANVSLHLRIGLPKEWVLINDVVLEPEPEEFSQTDHIVIGPAGMFVIETKAWEGAFVGDKDRWKRKQGNRWIGCHSPTKQNARHVKLIKKWLYEVCGLELPEDDSWIKPVVVFTKASWLKVKECSMPVFDGSLELTVHIRRQKEKVLSDEQVEKIIGLLVNPFAAQVEELALTQSAPDECNCGESETDGKGVSIATDETEIVIGKTKNGREFVRVSGTKEKAEQVWQQYQQEGKAAGEMKPDKFRDESWYFYLTKPQDAD